MTPTIEIEEIRIWKKESYESENPGRFVARVKLKNPKGNMDIPMAPEVAEPMLRFLAPVVVEFSRKAVSEIAAAVEQQLLGIAAGPTLEAIADKSE